MRRIWIGRGILVRRMGRMGAGVGLVGGGGVVVVLHWRTRRRARD